MFTDVYKALSVSTEAKEQQATLFPAELALLWRLGQQSSALLQPLSAGAWPQRRCRCPLRVVAQLLHLSLAGSPARLLPSELAREASLHRHAALS